MIRLCELNKDPAKYAGEVEIAGWVRTVRDSKNIGFIELSDGSCFRNVQVVYENNIPNDIIKQINTGCAISVVGDLVLTPDAKQPFEVKAREIKIEGLCASDYPPCSTSGRAPTLFRLPSGFATWLPRPYTASLTRGASCMYIRLSSLPATARARARCSG